jgi:hypothetical protein
MIPEIERPIRTSFVSSDAMGLAINILVLSGWMINGLPFWASRNIHWWPKIFSALEFTSSPTNFQLKKEIKD